MLRLQKDLVREKVLGSTYGSMYRPNHDYKRSKASTDRHKTTPTTNWVVWVSQRFYTATWRWWWCTLAGGTAGASVVRGRFLPLPLFLLFWIICPLVSRLAANEP